MARPRNICFVTGTRAEFGLMQRTLRAINGHPGLRLQIVATGMHLDRSRGDSVREIRKAGFPISATVPWAATTDPTPHATAVATGRAVAGLAAAFERLATDIVLVVGDRVEAFAAASAGHISGLCVAHVHGGDRALGQVDDALRHAITKLSHLHLPATAASAARIRKLGEDRWRIRRVGSPGIDGIVEDAAPYDDLAADIGPYSPGKIALVAYHPGSGDESLEYRRANTLLSAVRRIGFEKVVVVYPNNDPGSGGIVRCWEQRERDWTKDARTIKRHPPSPGTPGEGRAMNAEQGMQHGDRRIQPPVDVQRSAFSVQRLPDRALTLTLSRNRTRLRSSKSGTGNKDIQRSPPTIIFRRNLSRSVYLGLLRDAAVLVGNSSSGIIEAASFGAPVLDVGPRQQGREHGPNVVHVDYHQADITEALLAIWNGGSPRRFARKNLYGRGNAARQIAAVLAEVRIDDHLMRKLIAY